MITCSLLELGPTAAPSCLRPTSPSFSSLALSLSKQAIVGLHHREVSVHSAMCGCGCVLLCQLPHPAYNVLHQIAFNTPACTPAHPHLVMCIADSVIMLRCMQALKSWQLRAGCRAAVRRPVQHTRRHMDGNPLTVNSLVACCQCGAALCAQPAVVCKGEVAMQALSSGAQSIVMTGYVTDDFTSMLSSTAGTVMRRHFSSTSGERQAQLWLLQVLPLACLLIACCTRC